MRKQRKIIALLLVVMMLVVLMVGCSPKEEEEPAASGGGYAEEVIVSVGAAPPALDPNISTANASRRFYCHVYEPLLKFDPATKSPQPWLAESWEEPAPGEYIFKLREGVKFHNGETLTAADVKYTYERCLTLPAPLPFVEIIDKIEVVDDLTVKITLKDPSPIFLGNICHDVTSIVKEGSGDGLADNPNGTGAYIMVEHKVDDYVLFERFDDYWGGVKPTKRIRMRIIPDNNARNLALEAGDIHVGVMLHNADHSSLKNNPDFIIFEEPTNVSEFFSMNVSKPPFDDVHARRAVAYAMNKEAIVNGIYEGDVVNIKSLISPSAFGYDPDVKHYEYNVDKAKEELAKSKYPDGFEFDCYTTSSRGKYTEALQYDLSQIGITMNVEFVQNVDAVIDGGYKGAYITSGSFPTYDGDLIYRFVHSSNLGAGGNRAFYENPKIDELMDATRAEMNTAKREQLFKEVQEILYEDAVYLPILSKINKIGAVKGIGGIKPDPATIDYFGDVYLEQ